MRLKQISIREAGLALLMLSALWLFGYFWNDQNLLAGFAFLVGGSIMGVGVWLHNRYMQRVEIRLLASALLGAGMWTVVFFGTRPHDLTSAIVVGAASAVTFALLEDRLRAMGIGLGSGRRRRDS